MERFKLGLTPAVALLLATTTPIAHADRDNGHDFNRDLNPVMPELRGIGRSSEAQAIDQMMAEF